MHRPAVCTVRIAPEIIMTRSDRARLEGLLREHEPIRSWKAVAFLVGEMARARLVDDDEIGPTVVTIHSRVAFREDSDGDAMVATLTLPGERGLYQDAMSVLTASGAALLGLSEGQSITFVAPDGRKRTIAVDKVLYQPQAARAREGYRGRRSAGRVDDCNRRAIQAYRRRGSGPAAQH